jgi:hypothetical protein
MAKPQLQPGPIPFGRNSAHFFHIYNNLVEVLTAIKAKGLKDKILWVSCRLNRTGQNVPSPVFAGWVEANNAIRIRVGGGNLFAPVDLRFNDTNTSKLYEDCLKAPAKKVVSRDWSDPKQSPGATSQQIGVNFYQETHRRSMGIKIDDGSVGSLNAAFRGGPTDAEDREIGDVLFRWAQDPGSDLVTYIRNNLAYSVYKP